MDKPSRYGELAKRVQEMEEAVAELQTRFIVLAPIGNDQHQPVPLDEFVVALANLIAKQSAEEKKSPRYGHQDSRENMKLTHILVIALALLAIVFVCNANAKAEEPEEETRYEYHRDPYQPFIVNDGSGINLYRAWLVPAGTYELKAGFWIPQSCRLRHGTEANAPFTRPGVDVVVTTAPRVPRVATGKDDYWFYNEQTEVGYMGTKRTFEFDGPAMLIVYTYLDLRYWDNETEEFIYGTLEQDSDYGCHTFLHLYRLHKYEVVTEKQDD